MFIIIPDIKEKEQQEIDRAFDVAIKYIKKNVKVESIKYKHNRKYREGSFFSKYFSKDSGEMKVNDFVNALKSLRKKGGVYNFHFHISKVKIGENDLKEYRKWIKKKNIGKKPYLFKKDSEDIMNVFSKLSNHVKATGKVFERIDKNSKKYFKKNCGESQHKAAKKESNKEIFFPLLGNSDYIFISKDFIKKKTIWKKEKYSFHDFRNKVTLNRKDNKECTFNKKTCALELRGSREKPVFKLNFDAYFHPKEFKYSGDNEKIISVNWKYNESAYFVAPRYEEMRRFIDWPGDFTMKFPTIFENDKHKLWGLLYTSESMRHPEWNWLIKMLLELIRAKCLPPDTLTKDRIKWPPQTHFSVISMTNLKENEIGKLQRGKDMKIYLERLGRFLELYLAYKYLYELMPLPSNNSKDQCTIDFMKWAKSSYGLGQLPIAFPDFQEI